MIGTKTNELESHFNLQNVIEPHKASKRSAKFFLEIFSLQCREPFSTRKTPGYPIWAEFAMKVMTGPKWYETKISFPVRLFYLLFFSESET